MGESILSSPRASRLTRWLWPALFVLTLPLFIKLTFPYDAVAQRLQSEASKQNVELSIASMSSSGLLGVAASGVKVRQPPTSAGPSPEIELDRVSVSPDLLSLITRKVGFGFDVDAFGGNARGKARVSSDPKQPGLTALELDAKDLDLKSLPLQQLGSAEAIGKLSLKTSLPALEPVESTSGSVAITLKNAALIKALLPVPGMGNLTLPKTMLGELDGALTIDKGIAKVDKFALRGGDVEADVEGTIRLKALVAVSDLNLHVRLKFTDRWLDANPLVKGSLGFLGPKGTDGYWITVSGPLQRPNVRPGK
ncbi:MAG: type II secretion system protein GspN [Deltaproteobacteria bacterium]|nr:type II secretion system protein GspN [Deltaproteobacteria bacterium]